MGKWESANGAAVPPSFYCWDGKIMRAADGMYHLFASSWPGSRGFNPGWTGSDAIHATSSSVLGQYQRLGFAYDNGPDAADRHHGHNVSAGSCISEGGQPGYTAWLYLLGFVAVSLVSRRPR
jgi:hypothetical protein